MSLITVVYVVIDKNRVIICRNKDVINNLGRRPIRKLRKMVNKAVPDFNWPRNKVGHITTCGKTFPSYFDRTVSNTEENNNWDKFPFVTLRLLDKSNTCKATPVEICL